jgi:methionyl-tRNA synthetase
MISPVNARGRASGKRRLVTSALPYVNNVPHLGNLIQVLSADVFARFCRSRGYETLYICGTDEYGTATETRAAEEGVSPRELCDRYHAIHAQIYRWFNIAFDKFGRTSTPVQTEIVQGLFKELDAAGFIVERQGEQLYCSHCRRFLADRYVRGVCPSCGSPDARGDQCETCGKLLDPAELKDPRCASCGSTPELRPTRHLYIDLPALKDRLEAWIKDASVKGFWANNAIAMTKSWIRDGLRERAITRDLKWGIPVPKAGYEDKVFYVWFDAPIGYISITGCLGEDRSADKNWRPFVDHWWKSPDEVELFQFIGKDNIPFHTVIFPATLLGSGEQWTMLHHMSSTEYLNYEGGKFSKSKGVGVFGSDVMETGIPADVWRFYIFYNRPEKADALFTWKDFQTQVNGELIGNLGNLVNRTLSFVSRYYEGKISAVSGGDAGTFKDFWETVHRYEDAITEEFERADLRDAFRTIFELSDFANKAFQDGEPWKKRTSDPAAAEALISNLCYVVKDLAILIAPFMPASAEAIAAFFELPGLEWGDLGKTTGLERVASTKVLFNKLEDDMINELRERYSGTQKEREEKKEPAHTEPAPVAAPEAKTYEYFAQNVALRTATVVSVEKHPNADKLFVLHLDIAGEERVICSGLVGIYTEEQLLGKHIIVAYNLKGRKMRGIESRGMLLAAEKQVTDADGETHEIVDVLDSTGLPSGTWVSVEGIDIDPADKPAEIDFETFAAVPMKVKDFLVSVDGKALLLNNQQVKAALVDNGTVH